MSPAASKSKSMSKEKSASVKGAKELKAVSKSSAPTNPSISNVVSGTLGLLEASTAASSPPPNGNGRFHNTDDSDDHSSSPHGTVSEYDSVSNNGSCSGESEDLKEKAANSAAPQREALTAADSDRREKIRLKNEKKHQRQRERRALELHEKCCSYLMSRKLEALSQQLVNMGFSSERATLALILNEGRVEDSVSWLFEGNKEESPIKEAELGNQGNINIDISEELNQFSQLEAKYKCSKQEVERAVVACEGDLAKAEESLRVHKHDKQRMLSKQEATVDSKNLPRLHEKPVSTSVMIPQGRNYERDLNYNTATLSTSSDTDRGLPNLNGFNGNHNRQVLNGERRWPNAGFNPSHPSTIGMSQMSSLGARSEAFHGVGEENFNQHSAVREPMIMMRRHDVAFPRRSPASGVTTSPSVSAGFYVKDAPSDAEILNSHMKFLHSQKLGNFGRENQVGEPFYGQFNGRSSTYRPFDSVSETGSSWNAMGWPSVPSDARESWGSMMGGAASSHSIAAPPSLGLFSSWGSPGSFVSNSQVDWHTGGSVPEFDYTSIDWTHDSSLNGGSKGSSMWLGVSSLARGDQVSRMVGSDSRFFGLQDNINGVVSGRDPAAVSGGQREWTSFTGKDIFSLPRQFVTSPSL